MSSENIRAAIIATDFNKDIVDPMIEAAQDELKQSSGHVAQVVRVPGAYEIPIIADILMRQSEIDLVVVLGYIERGETLHGEVMGQVVHRAFVDLELKYGKVIGIGIIGPGATLEQAKVRNIDYARAAAKAAVRNHKTVGSLRV